MGNPKTVRDEALRVCEITPHYYTEDLLNLIPEEILNTELNANDVRQLSKIALKIDSIRAQKEGEFSTEELEKMLATDLEELPEEQENKRKEIIFLMNVGLRILDFPKQQRKKILRCKELKTGDRFIWKNEVEAHEAEKGDIPVFLKISEVAAINLASKEIYDIEMRKEDKVYRIAL